MTDREEVFRPGPGFSRNAAGAEDLGAHTGAACLYSAVSGGYHGPEGRGAPAVSLLGRIT
jgi:hypothetical protein